jgi:hypothetical protein
MVQIIKLSVATSVLSLLLIACGRKPAAVSLDALPTAPVRKVINEKIRLSSSEDEFNQYVKQLTDHLNESQSQVKSQSTSASSTDSASPAGAGKNDNNETITNNQEKGVDEGDIVKNVGDHLVILRRGELYSVLAQNGAASALSASVPVAVDPALAGGVWYDEMLVKGRNVYVTGYRYATLDDNNYSSIGATEINIFRLEESGQFKRLTQTFIESSDYYSSKNYASRIVNGKLALYMPRSAFDYRDNSYVFSGTYTLEYAGSGKFRRKRLFTDWKDVYLAPTLQSEYYALHTLALCELPDNGSIECTARSFVGSFGREYYISSDSFFLWLEGFVFKWDLKDLKLSAHSAQGTVLNQFSFRQDKTHLHVVASMPLITINYSATDEGCRMLPSVRTVLSSYPLSAFDDRAMQTDEGVASKDIFVGASSFGPDQNRFAGDWLFATRRSYKSASGTPETEIVVTKPFSDLQSVHKFQGAVTRIEPVGTKSAFIVTLRSNQSEDERTVSAGLKLVDAERPDWNEAWLDLAGYSEKESRSHGFFFKPDGNGISGIIGLPVLSAATGSHMGMVNFLGRGSSNIAYFRISDAAQLSHLGTISSRPEQEQQCNSSCYDWYGNTRPVFLRDRAFALMGSEFQKVLIGQSGVSEQHDRVFLKR